MELYGEYENAILKYLRTFHLPFSKEVFSDDKVILKKHLENFIGKRVLILEKLDGQNNCCKGPVKNKGIYPGVYARTHAQETQLPWDSYIIAWYHNYKYSLNEDTWYFFENLFAKHSIEYNRLPSYMHLINLYNPETNEFAAWKDVQAEAKRLDLYSAPVLFDGVFDSINEVQDWMDKRISGPSVYGDVIEGFIIRPAEAFKAEDFTKVVAKYVRNGHVQTDEHWTKNWKQASLF